MTIRARLTAWYALALAAGLSLFGAAIWLSMRSSLSASLDATLADHGRSLAQFIQHELESPYPPHLATELREFSQGLPQGISIELRDGKDSLLFASVRQPFRHQHAHLERVFIHGKPYQITVAGSLEPIDETLEQLRNLLFACTPIVILIAAAGGYWLSRRALKPVTSIIDAAQTISIDNLSRRLAVPQTGDELQRLSETWNAVLARLESAVNRLSQFTADASHELRTPLAVIRATAELAARKFRTPEAYRAALNEVVTEADRMAQLVDDLLFLARCDAGARDMPQSDLDLAEVIGEACASLSPLASSKEIHMATQLQPAPVTGNAAALRRLALVLLDNAIKYTPSGGHVTVTLEANRLRVADTGIGIQPEALPHIFERFYQADPARSHSGYGLGLAQAQSIAASHGARILVSSRPGEGSVFEVSFTPPQNRDDSKAMRPVPDTSHFPRQSNTSEQMASLYTPPESPSVRSPRTALPDSHAGIGVPPVHRT
jgi:heavy metal sensor kinase